MGEGVGRRCGTYAVLGLGIFIALMLFACASAQAAPQLPGGPDGYGYRVAISTNSSLNQTNIQVPFTINTASLVSAGKLRSDCADLRATSSGGAELGMWLETGCNTSTTRIWILVPFVPAGLNDVAYLYYGNPGAASASSVNATFFENAIRAEMRNCDPSANNSYCPITSHAQADTVRGMASAFCAMNVTKIEWGDVCYGHAPGMNSWDNSGTVYRFLFVPDVGGSWGFQTRADNWSELSASTTDEVITNFHTLIVSNYVDDHTNRTGSLSMSAGGARWMSYVTSDRNGPEEQTLWIRRPGGSYQLASTTNFPGMLLTRKYPTSGSFPAAFLGAETAAPPVPTGNAQGGLNATYYNVTFSWSASGSGATCRIFARDSPAAAWTSVYTQTANALGQCFAHNQSNAGLAPNTTRQYMAYFSKVGYGDGFPLFLNATTYGPPYAPDITGSTRSNQTIQVLFTPAQAQGVPVLGHKAFVSINGSGFNQWATLSGSATSYTITNATNGVNYSFYFAGTSTLGESPASDVQTFRTWTTPYPPVLQSLMDGNRSAQISWTPGYDGGSPIQGYRVFVGGVAVADVAAANGTTYTITNMTNGNTNSVSVTAANEDGWGNPSNILYSTPGAVPWPPEDVDAIRGDSIVTVAWENPEDEGYPISHYTIFRGASSGATAPIVNVTFNSTRTWWNDTNVTNGQLYYYNMTATNAKGTSASSWEVSARPATRPTAPLNLTITPGNHSFLLSWDPPASDGGEPIVDYVISGGEVGTGGDDFANTGGSNRSFLVYHPALPNGVPYFFNVSAENAVDYGPNSTNVTSTAGTWPNPPGTSPRRAGTRSWTSPGAFRTRGAPRSAATTSGWARAGALRRRSSRRRRTAGTPRSA